jgi:D-3-phosphoglycerate dehydrogenase / 2-oxoglutarate reductase
MTKPRLLIAESRDFSPAALQLLADNFAIDQADLSRDELLQCVADYDVLWVKLRNMIDQTVIQAGQRLKMIVTNTTGLNHIDLQAAEAQGVRVISLRGEVDFLKNIRATAELTIGLVLALLRHIPHAHQHVLNGQWDRSLFRGTEIYNKSVGIIGYGRLGRIVAKYLQAFDARPIVSSRELDPGNLIDGFEVTSLEQLLAQADIVSLHVNYEPQNQHMMGQLEFEQMKPGAYFINTSRGELVDEAALLHCLKSGKLGGAALDVVDQELERTDNRSPLTTYAQENGNLILTPHIGGNTWDSAYRTEEFIASQVSRLFLEGR